ncbi:hypothetical protein DOY81_015318, partial [Sarcophaga bullata]
MHRYLVSRPGDSSVAHSHVETTLDSVDDYRQRIRDIDETANATREPTECPAFQPPAPVRLSWQLEPCLPQINEAVRDANLLIKDIDLRILVHDQYGKGFM